MSTHLFSESDKLRIIELRGAGESYAQIGESVGCSKSGAKYVFDKYKDEGTIQNNWNLLGRPKSYSDRSERHLFRYLWDHPYTHLRDINDIANLNVHVSTVSRIVENQGFDIKVSTKRKPLMTNSNKEGSGMAIC